LSSLKTRTEVPALHQNFCLSPSTCATFQRMPEPAPAPETPQFETAEYQGVTTPDWCRTCKQTVVGTYYRVKGEMACASCAEVAKGKAPAGSHGAFARAVVFGGFAAVAGLVLYAAVAIITGWMIGYVSLAVGFIIGKAMMMGSRGLGGRRYQITALALTYAAVSLAAIPIALSDYIGNDTSPQSAQVQQQASPESAPAADQGEQQMTLAKATGSLLLFGLASPFLSLAEPVHGFIGLIILFVGLQIAWKITAGSEVPEVEGPYNV
jgi:hypothetical protein